MKELVIYEPQAAADLLADVKKFFLSKGIMLPKKFSAAKNSEIQSSENGGDWIKPFFIQTDTPAFYLDINSPDDIEETHSKIENGLANLKSKLKNFLDNNGELDGILRDKINTFATQNLTQAGNALKFTVKKEIKKESESCNNIDKLREVARRIYGEFLKKEFLDRIIVSLYEGLKDTPNEDAYIYVLGEANNFLSELGVMTAAISVGDIWDEKTEYDISDEKKYFTSNVQEKDTVREILRYAYVFQENKGSDNYSIMNGEVIVMIYKPEG